MLKKLSAQDMDKLKDKKISISRNLFKPQKGKDILIFLDPAKAYACDKSEFNWEVLKTLTNAWDKPIPFATFIEEYKNDDSTNFYYDETSV